MNQGPLTFLVLPGFGWLNLEN